VNLPGGGVWINGDHDIFPAETAQKPLIGFMLDQVIVLGYQEEKKIDKSKG
jgi:hypothetical protein